METSKQEFFKSLDLIDEELEKYIPLILEDLWELGSMPEFIIELIKKNIQPFNIDKIVDFGCGKGAVLVQLAKHFEFNGLGIDIVPQFIESAEKYALKSLLSDKNPKIGKTDSKCLKNSTIKFKFKI